MILRVIKENKFEVKEMIASGGATKSKLWLQIYSDVTGIPIKTTTTPEAAALGSAILGAVAAGKYGSIVEAANKMVKFKDIVTPNMNNYRKYKFFVDQYKSTYLSLKDSMHKVGKYISDL